MSRQDRRQAWEARFDPGLLAITGVIVSACLLLQPLLSVRIVVLGAAGLTAWLSGRRVSFITAFLVMTGIVMANLVVPVGRKLFAVGPLVVTEIALLEGMRKAVTFEALMFISKACLGPGIRLPGRFGAFFADALRTYDRIMEKRGSIRLKTFFKNIDEVLLSVYHAETGISADVKIRSASASGTAMLLVVMLLSAVSLVTVFLPNA